MLCDQCKYTAILFFSFRWSSYAIEMHNYVLLDWRQHSNILAQYYVTDYMEL